MKRTKNVQRTYKNIINIIITTSQKLMPAFVRYCDDINACKKYLVFPNQLTFIDLEQKPTVITLQRPNPYHFD